MTDTGKRSLWQQRNRMKEILLYKMVSPCIQSRFITKFNNKLKLTVGFRQTTVLCVQVYLTKQSLDVCALTAAQFLRANHSDYLLTLQLHLRTI